MNGLAQLRECVELMLGELRELREQVTRALPVPEDATRPLTALELMERWHIAAETPELRLTYLARKAREWGLQPLAGTRGWDALYPRADVLHAEEYAAGRIRRRKHAVRGNTEGRRAA
ncbi:MAG: hypothetical protein KCHDKBKB_03026 [Elusimicrobia bacterium]|nr:hypothetical protein [Elusimicrobiota bacterium]